MSLCLGRRGCSGCLPLQSGSPVVPRWSARACPSVYARPWASMSPRVFSLVPPSIGGTCTHKGVRPGPADHLADCSQACAGIVAPTRSQFWTLPMPFPPGLLGLPLNPCHQGHCREGVGGCSSSPSEWRFFHKWVSWHIPLPPGAEMGVSVALSPPSTADWAISTPPIQVTQPICLLEGALGSQGHAGAGCGAQRGPWLGGRGLPPPAHLSGST